MLGLDVFKLRTQLVQLCLAERRLPRRKHNRIFNCRVILIILANDSIALTNGPTASDGMRSAFVTDKM